MTGSLPTDTDNRTDALTGLVDPTSDVPPGTGHHASLHNDANAAINTLQAAQVALESEVAAVPPATAVNAASFGVKVRGEVDDTTALQSAVSNAVTLKEALYLPPGVHRITKTIEAKTDDFCIYGAGRRSVLAPTTAAFDALVIGPGSEGSGPQPSGFARDFEIVGNGNAEVTKAGVASTTGKAALKLNGMRMFDVTNVGVSGSFDIGFDLVNNCYGSSFRNARTGLQACRVGVNLRKGEENGEDLAFYNCWLAGEVAAVHAAGSGKNYRFHGGQLTAGRQLTTDEDLRGVVILNKDYTTGTVTAETEVHMQLQTSFEFWPHVWGIRSFGIVRLDLASSFNPGGSSGKGIGFFKGSGLLFSKVQMRTCNIHNAFSKPAAEMVILEGANSDFTWVEDNSYGQYEDATGSTHAEYEPMFKRAQITYSKGTWGEDTNIGKGVILRSQSGALQVSYNWGSTWKTVKAE